jgi:hypothetical protein
MHALFSAACRHALCTVIPESPKGHINKHPDTHSTGHTHRYCLWTKHDAIHPSAAVHPPTNLAAEEQCCACALRSLFFYLEQPTEALPSYYKKDCPKIDTKIC